MVSNERMMNGFHFKDHELEASMGWIESLSKEAFQLSVREAVRPDLEMLTTSIKEVEKRIGELKQRVSPLEGTIEGSMRAYEANIGRMFAEFKADMFKRMLDTPREH
jgi:hypothetical protein